MPRVGVGPGREIGQVVDADLDDVGAARGPRRAGRGRPARSRMTPRPAVRIEHDEGARRRPPAICRGSADAIGSRTRPSVPRWSAAGAGRQRALDRPGRQSAGAEVSAVWNRYVARAVVIELGDRPGSSARRSSRSSTGPRHRRPARRAGARRTDPSTEPPEERHLAAEPADRSGCVERPAAGRRP